MTTVAFLGLGRMGLPMATNLCKAGHDLVVWNRSPAKAGEFARQHGARVGENPAACAAVADVVISMLADDAAVLAAHTQPDGTFAALRPGAVVVDMSTIAVDTARQLAEAAGRRDLAFLDAPVSGSVAAATAGTLTVMVGGGVGTLAAVRPVLSAMGDSVIHLGENGAGAAMKLSVNAVVHELNGAISEALVLAERSGIDRQAAYAVFLNSAVTAPFVQYRQAAFEQPETTPVAFRMTLAAKDLRNALGLAQTVGLDLPHASTALQVLQRAVDAGFADHDESAVAQYLRGVPPQP